ncbi:hypothetical protein Lfu02_56740 [Longispora fulva]|uniref:Uncharacterized protein n=1 Tax=Longispora fulva TaxID=619741 RepID=A0A8J7KJX0_9ACTN|nr:hypothetical protein [Longispora fulva]MBG6137344.1 hypothetical protein [Longispora fulva]GIG61302.1 hypothetical protein Lfu02_56740 [Longispora fulva]
MSDQQKRDRPDFISSRMQRRRAKIAQELARNREGGHKIPTWVLATILVLVLVGWLALIFLP